MSASVRVRKASEKRSCKRQPRHGSKKTPQGKPPRGEMISVTEITFTHDPSEWFQDVCSKLCFKSQAAMHRAIALATGIKYDTVHKALTRCTPGRRIRAEIKDCLTRWLARHEKGLRPDTDLSLLSVPADEARGVLRALRYSYADFENALAEASQVSGSSRATLLRYLSDSEEKPFPAEGYDALAHLLQRRRMMFRVMSYLSDDEKRTRVQRLSARLREFLARWRENPARTAFHHRFRELRLQLIAEMKNEEELTKSVTM